MTPRAAVGWTLGAPLASAAMLALADAPAYLAPLQVVAFVPFLVAVRRWQSWPAALLGGSLLALRFTLFAPALGALPWGARFAVVLYLLCWHAAFGGICYGLRLLFEPMWSLVIGLAFAALEIYDAALPMWGTALSLATPWAARPWPIGLVRYGGHAPLAFMVVAVQSLAVAFIREQRKVVPALYMVGLIAACVLAGRTKTPTPSRTLRVGVVGWSDADGPTVLEGLVADAARQGARLVVSPEAVYDVAPEDREARLAELGAMARRYRVHLAVGYLDRKTKRNRVVAFDPTGTVVADYAKKHMVPLAEKMEAGDGVLTPFRVDGIEVGIVICQDDNFDDTFNGYRHLGAALIVSPTYEMSPAMGRLHLRSALLRPLESGVAYARAAAHGTSAIVSSTGVVLASYDHLERGSAALVADVAVP